MSPETLPIDRFFKGVGRIKKATGTRSPAVRTRISEMLTELHQGNPPRLDILRAIKDGELTLLQVYEAYKAHALDRLPMGLTAQPLGAAMQAWIDTLVVPDDYSESHVQSLGTSRKYFVKEWPSAKVAGPKARVTDLPAVLEELRDLLGRKHPRSFNLARSAALAFVRAKLKRNHPLWLACAAVEPRKRVDPTKRRPLSPEEMRELFPHPDTKRLDRVAWAMATTGMHAKEYWGRWSIEADHILILGTKRAGRVRKIPLVLAPAVPAWKNRRNFEDALREKTRAMVAYDLRRTYAHWMELAGIPRTRRRMYLGHAAKDVTDLYEEHEVRAFLAEDAAKLRTFLGLDAAPLRTFTVVQGGA